MADKTLLKEENFDKLSKVKLKTDKKGRFTYASWSSVWKEVKKHDSKASFKVYEKETVKDGVLHSTGKPVFPINEKAGAMVKVGVTIDDQEYVEFYPITDHYNKAIAYERIDVMHINTAIKRALVKAVAYTGLGLHIYEGEDLPGEKEE